MRYILTAPKSINCEITLPASKSISNRALVINALAGNKEHPENLSKCDDTDVMVAALRDMPYEINIKAAGTAMRFTTALLAVGDGEHVITGTERMGVSGGRSAALVCFWQACPAAAAGRPPAPGRRHDR